MRWRNNDLNGTLVRYEHIEGVTVTAQFAWEAELHFCYRLEIVLKDVAPTGKTRMRRYAKPERCRRGRG